VLSLAITDTLAPITVMPLTLTWSALSRFVFGQEACEFQAIMIFSLGTVSAITITLMAVNRFVCVCKPQKYKKIFNKKTSLIMIGTVWITIFLSMTLFLKCMSREFAFITFVPNRIMCFIMTGSKNTSSILGSSSFTALMLTPFVIIVYCCFRVFKKIREHKKNIAPSSNQNNLGSSVQEIKTTWVLFAVLMGYCLTWIPVFLLIFLTNVRWFDVPRQAEIVLTYAGPCSSAINPMIYGMLNAAFRKEFANVLGFK
jgi:melatonin receptor type 1A